LTLKKLYYITIASLSLFICGFAEKSKSQSNEFSLHVYSGLYSYGGESAPSSPYNGQFNPYGDKSGSSIGFAIQAQVVSKNKFIFGFQMGYQSFSSIVKEVHEHYITSHWAAPYSYEEKSSTTLNFNYINLNLLFGKRLSTSSFDFDFISGIEAGLTLSNGNLYLSSEENYGGWNAPTEVSPPPMGIDARLIFQINSYYKNIGLITGYYYGISNYANVDDPELAYLEDGSKIFSRMIRLGVIFRI
jgi:hypothetical protein